MFQLKLTPGKLTMSDLRRVYKEEVSVELDAICHEAVYASAACVQKVLDEGRTVYGINTGFGLLAQTRIEDHDLKLLQRSLVLSHAAGTGDLLNDEIVRLIMVLKMNSLARGHSGIRLSVIEMIAAMINKGIYPCIPAKGSVGASGDLAPLAHMSTAMLGEGHVRVEGKVIPAAEGLAQAGLEPVVLGPKEGLALLNGTQVSTALALAGLFMAEANFKAGLIAGALSVDAALGTDAAFDSRIHEVRGHRGQIEVAGVFRSLLKGSEIRNSHEDCDKVQDPYSLRCQPQVLGPCLEHLRFAAATLLVESNAVSDNPLVFAEQNDILSGGNFHAEPVAMAADTMALSIAEIGSLSERRMALLIDRHLSGLPPFLVENSGVNSGFMIAQVTSAALASENKSLAHPASVDSLPTSANQEDHVSMATFAARRLTDMNDNTTGILAVEWLAAAQGVGFRAPLKTSEPLAKAIAILREVVPFYDKDRYFAPDIEAASKLIKADALSGLIGLELF